MVKNIYFLFKYFHGCVWIKEFRMSFDLDTVFTNDVNKSRHLGTGKCVLELVASFVKSFL